MDSDHCMSIMLWKGLSLKSSTQSVGLLQKQEGGQRQDSEGNQSSLMASDLFHLIHNVKPEAGRVVAALHRMGMRVWMMT
eukprot:scaffold118235_cov24-Tisochrysis_lutea.AAC.3